MTQAEIAKKIEDLEFEAMEIAKAIKERVSSDETASAVASSAITSVPLLFKMLHMANEAKD